MSGQQIGCPRRSIVVNSVVMKRSKTCWTSAGSDAVTPRSLLRVAGRLGVRPPGMIAVAVAVGTGAAGRARRESDPVQRRIAHVLRRADPCRRASRSSCSQRSFGNRIVVALMPSRTQIAAQGSRETSDPMAKNRSSSRRAARRGEVRAVPLPSSMRFSAFGMASACASTDRFAQAGLSLPTSSRAGASSSPKRPVVEAVGQLGAQLARDVSARSGGVPPTAACPAAGRSAASS